MHPDSFQVWLERVCAMVPGVRGAALVTGSARTRLATWPAGVEPEGLLAVLDAIDDEQSMADAVVRRWTHARHGALVLVLRTDLPRERRAALEPLLDWSLSWLDFVDSHGPGDWGDARSEAAHGLLRELARVQDPATAGGLLADALVESFGVTHAWLGVERGRGVRRLAASRGARALEQLDDSLLRAALDDLCLHDAPVRAVATDQASPIYSLARLRDALGVEQLLGLPVVDATGVCIVILLAGDHDATLDPEAVDRFVDAALPLLTRLLALAPGPLGRMEKRLGGTADALGRRGVTRARIVLACILGVVLLLAFGRGDHEIRADAVIEGRVLHAISAPFDGFVASAEARAGDLVEAGDVLARMDDEELRLELRRTEGEVDALERAYRQALASVDQPQMRITGARLEQAAASAALLRARLERVDLRAPASGVVIAGDLSRAIGAPVSRGDLLFELAPRDAYRIVLQVPESDVDALAPEQRGRLRVTAFPDLVVPIRVARIASVLDEEGEGDVRFRVEAELEAEFEQLRPGMEGVARVEIGRRSLWWIYTHAALDRLRLLAWRWLP